RSSRTHFRRILPRARTWRSSTSGSGRACLVRFPPCRPPRSPPASPTGSAPSAPRCHVSAPCSTCPREPAQHSVARVGAEQAPPLAQIFQTSVGRGCFPYSLFPTPHSRPSGQNVIRPDPLPDPPQMPALDQRVEVVLQQLRLDAKRQRPVLAEGDAPLRLNIRQRLALSRVERPAIAVRRHLNRRAIQPDRQPVRCRLELRRAAALLGHLLAHPADSPPRL